MRKKSVISLLTLVTSLTLTACSFQFSTPKDFPQVPDQVQEISVELGKEISDIVDSTDFTDADQLDQMTTEVVEWAKDYAETEESISEFQKATLMRVVDGDTIVVEIDGEEYKSTKTKFKFRIDRDTKMMLPRENIVKLFEKKD